MHNYSKEKVLNYIYEDNLRTSVTVLKCTKCGKEKSMIERKVDNKMINSEDYLITEFIPTHKSIESNNKSELKKNIYTYIKWVCSSRKVNAYVNTDYRYFYDKVNQFIKVMDNMRKFSKYNKTNKISYMNPNNIDEMIIITFKGKYVNIVLDFFDLKSKNNIEYHISLGDSTSKEVNIKCINTVYSSTMEDVSERDFTIHFDEINKDVCKITATLNKMMYNILKDFFLNKF